MLRCLPFSCSIPKRRGWEWEEKLPAQTAKRDEHFQSQSVYHSFPVTRHVVLPRALTGVVRAGRVKVNGDSVFPSLFLTRAHELRMTHLLKNATCWGLFGNSLSLSWFVHMPPASYIPFRRWRPPQWTAGDESVSALPISKFMHEYVCALLWRGYIFLSGDHRSPSVTV